MILGVLLKTILSFGILVALTRLIPPTDFGLVAMLSLFIGFSAVLTEAGMGAALIQASSPSELDKSTLFWTQIGLGTFYGAALAFGGVGIASLFGYPILAPLAVAYGASTFVGAFVPVQRSLFAKAIMFKSIIKSQIAAEFAAGALAITLALNGAGVWALVSLAVARNAVLSLMLWFLSDWRPRLAFSLASLRRYLAFSSFTMGNTFLSEVELRVGAFFLGQEVSASATGYFHRASGLKQELAKAASGSITKVAFPTLSALQEDNSRFVSALRQALFVNFCTTAMIMWTIAAAANPLVHFVFGEPWLPMAPVLQAFCVAAGFHPCFAVLAKALRAIGLAQLVFWQFMVRAVGAILLSALFAHAGIVTLAWFLACFSIALTPIYLTAAALKLSYKMQTQVADLAPVVLAGVSLGFITFSIAELFADLPLIIRLTLLLVASPLTFLTTLIFWHSVAPVYVFSRTIENLRAFVFRSRRTD